MVTQKDLDSFLSRLSYKKDYIINLFKNEGFKHFSNDIPMYIIHLHIKMKTVDVSTGEILWILHSGRVDGYTWDVWSEKDKLRWVRSSIIDLEVHEADEWLKLDGIAVFYPHKVV